MSELPLKSQKGIKTVSKKYMLNVNNMLYATMKLHLNHTIVYHFEYNEIIFLHSHFIT